MHTIKLSGCNPIPLIGYLKALGLVRILSEQLNEKPVSCRWENGVFILRMGLGEDDMIQFFLERYVPSPFVSPWNAGSGFYFQEGKSGEKGIDGKKVKTGVRNQATEATRSITTVQESKGNRFTEYREMIGRTKELLSMLKRDSAPPDEEKKDLLRDIRNTFPDRLINWVDAAFVFSGDKLVPPPLLLSGGNEGNLDFSNTFIQNLLSVINTNTDLPSERSEAWLRSALFGGSERLLGDSSSGYFAPSIRGGANSTTGFTSQSHTNPWDFILTMEGIVLLTGNATKKLNSNKYETSFPFCVKASSGGYASGENKEGLKGKGEVWLPIWGRFASYQEIQCVFAEGRANLGKRSARTGVDFAQAVASLGVDRGLNSFIRYGILPRFGDSYFASPLQEIKVRRDPVITDLLAASEDWISRFLPQAKADTAPSSLRRAANRLEAAIFAQSVAAQNNNFEVAQELLVSLGGCEHALAQVSERWRKESHLNPLPPLPRGWIAAVDDGTPEYRLAAALASVSAWFKKDFFPIRRHLEPVKMIPGEKAWVEWEDEAKNDVVWNDGSIVNVLCAMMKRRLLLAKASGEPKWLEFAKVSAWPSDIAAFIAGQTDDKRFADLLWGLSLVNFSTEAGVVNLPNPPRDQFNRDKPLARPPAFYAQLKLCFAGHLPERKEVPIEPIIFNLAANGDGTRASQQALRRLHGSSIPIIHLQIPLSEESARRCAAALLFPLWYSDAGYSQLAEACSVIAPDFFSQLKPH